MKVSITCLLPSPAVPPPPNMVSSQPTDTEALTPPPEPVSTVMPQLDPSYAEFDHQWVTETPLHRAVVEAGIEAVESSLAQGTDINAQATIRLVDAQWEGMTPLHLAALTSTPP